MKPAEPQAIVIFGASGDLTRRKLLPAFYHLFVEGLLPEGFALVGYARTPMTDQSFRRHARDAIKEFARCDAAGEQWEEFEQRLSYLTGEFDSELAMDHLRDHLEAIDRRHGTNGRRLFYCATPPTAYPTIAARVGESGLQRHARVVIEKPFGRDIESARTLNAALHEVFDESQIFRIDHYLGKETVQNILALRFANGMFEPIWNRGHVDEVQITVAEDIGIEGRASFYEETGAIRDMVQTHLFQVLTFFAMEPPVSFHANRIHDEKIRLLRSIRPVSPHAAVRGQFIGYRDEPDVAPDSRTETYAALRVEIDNWRWAGVPFNLRTGKRLKRKVSEICLSFRPVPYKVFEGTDAIPFGRDALVIRVHPNEGISLHLNIKKPAPGFDLDRATLDFDYDEVFHTPLIEAYELLLLEAMEGDDSLFIREDEVERAWEALSPVLEHPPPLELYEPGTWGPEGAEALILPHHWSLTASRE